MLFGMDYLGGAMFGSLILKAHPTGWAAGFFADTFGNCFPVADKLAASGKCPLIRIHGPWTAHKYNPAQHDKAIFAACDKTYKLQQKYPNVEFQFSPVCESDARGKQWQNLFSRLSEKYPMTLVCSVYKGEFLKGYISEVHGPKGAPGARYNYSYDGTSAVDANVQDDKQTHRDADVFFMWHPSFNLKYKTKVTLEDKKKNPKVYANDTAPPKERHCKPTVELIQSLEALAPNKGKPVLQKRNLWKSHADRHNTPPEPRAYKPVLISPVKADHAVLMDGAVVVATSSKREPYNDGRWRYYFPKYGYQLATRVVRVLVGKTDIGQVNPPFREGDYRS